MTQNNLSHHFLLPTAKMRDPRFMDSLVYICRHADDGAWGFVVNQPSSSISVGGLLHDLGIGADSDTMRTPAMNGGPVRSEAGFVLHTGLPKFRSSFAISENICLTTSKDILPLIAHAGRLSHYMMLMGFCSWKHPQLIAEIEAGSWLSCPAKIDILFSDDHANKLARTYALMGIDADKLVPVIGQA